MNDFRSIAGYALQHDVMGLLASLINGQVVLQNSMFLLVLQLDLYGKSLLAQFALQVLPKEGRDHLTLPLDLLALQPFLEAI